MSAIEKFLKIEEQSFLLASVLFSPETADKLFMLLPNSQAKMLLEAKKEFVTLYNDNIFKAAFELKRLLELDTYNFSDFHVSWIKKKLTAEPKYLRKIIFHIARKKKLNHELNFNETLVLENFFSSFQYSRLKIARHESFLIKLQAKANEKTELMDFLCFISKKLLPVLAQNFDEKRFWNFLKRRDVLVEQEQNDAKNVNENFIKDQKLKLFFIRNSFFEKKIKLENLALLAAAIYLRDLKQSWHTSIAYSMPEEIGQRLLSFIVQTKELQIEKNTADDFNKFLSKISLTVY